MMNTRYDEHGHLCEPLHGYSGECLLQPMNSRELRKYNYIGGCKAAERPSETPQKLTGVTLPTIILLVAIPFTGLALPNKLS